MVTGEKRARVDYRIPAGRIRSSAGEIRELMVDIVTNSDSGFDPWFARESVCPRDKSDLRRDGERLSLSPASHLSDYR